ncbi:hypothetical protein [Campylobacter gastrosuis]|uniref:Uncharacterized protein n=1 Tax=Campylobacter gastrosuis TaxID=2974576 RepID=A0ABT7HN67_9BACT|nr:hypothetical protein [Campylobacter gastrosuis]MDL0088157.1 hypothetical protein [Campylobacter gastrosuis]
MGNYESFLKARGLSKDESAASEEKPLSDEEKQAGGEIELSDSDKPQEVVSPPNEIKESDKDVKDDGASKQTTSKGKTGIKKPK